MESADLQGADLQGATLERAYLLEANLEGAYLERAYLLRADLEGANLKGTMYENDIPIMINTEYYSIVKCRQYIQIGCEKHTPEEWLAFTEDRINKMDKNALEFWRKYKYMIFGVR